ncbi:MAG: DUF2628 domain-containing protein [Pseudomonadota bacterium]
MARFAFYEKAGERRVVREGRNHNAFLFTSFWLIAKGLWLEAAGVFVFICFVALPLVPAAPLAAMGLLVLPGIYLWLEGQNMVAHRLERRGWALVALVEATTQEGAEIAYQMRSLQTQSAGSTAVRPPHAAGSAATPPPLPNAARPKMQGNKRGPAPFGLEGL